MENFFTRVFVKASFLMLALVCCFTVSGFSQGTVSGVVEDSETGEPLPGVNVIIKGSTQGTATNSEGKYSLPVPEGGTLVFTSIGYVSREVVVDNQSVINVALVTDVKTLADLVIIGYGEQRRDRVIGSIGTIDAKVIEQSAGIVSPEQVLQGRISGVNVTTNSGIPGQGFRVNIRGATSITGDNEPLYVVDGVPLNTSSEAGFNFGIARESPIAHINPNDIASIVVLKDASATAIYGSRATNGVVLITTKQGKEGPTQINISSSVGIGKVPKRVDIASSDAYFEVMNEARANYNRDHGLSPGDPGFETPLEDPRQPGHVDTDWFDLVTRDQAITENYNVSASGGNERTQFYISGSHARNEGIIKSNQFERSTVRFNLDHKASDRLDVSANVGLSRSVNNRIQNGSSGRGLLVRSLEQRPFDKPYFEDGSYQIGGVDILRHNGVQVINEQDVSLNKDKVIFDVAGIFEIVQGLRFESKVGGQFSFVHEYAHLTGLHPRGGPGGVVHDWRSDDRNVLLENTLKYDHAIGDKLHISGLLGHTFQKFTRERGYLQGRDFPSSGFGYITSAGTIQEGWTDWTSFAMESFIGRVNVNYDDRFSLSATLRRDGSSKFSGDNRYGLFPSAAVGWRISREPFLDDLETLSELRLRVSYGITGNQAGIGNFSAVPSATGGQNYRQNTGMAITNVGNPDLTWETSNQFNAGLDVGLFEDRLTLIADYFIQNTNDLLYNRPLHTTTGFSSFTQNIGSMSNRGLEIAINSVNTNGKLRWNTGLNISFIKNELKSLIDDAPIPTGHHVLQVGEPLGAFFMLQQLGVYQFDDDVPQRLYDEGVRAGDIIFEDVNGDQTITSDDRKVVGSPNPEFYGGLTNDLSYKNLDLNVFVRFKYGNKLLNTWARRLDSFGRYNYALREENIEERWTGPGTSNKQPRASLDTYNTQFSTRFLEDASYIRLQNVTLGYTLPAHMTDAINIRRVRLYLTGTNLVTFTDYSGMDPEVSLSLNPAELGEDHFNVPSLRSLTFGIDIGL